MKCSEKKYTWLLQMTVLRIQDVSTQGWHIREILQIKTQRVDRGSTHWNPVLSRILRSHQPQKKKKNPSTKCTMNIEQGWPQV